ncbi:MAG: hypothetical protein AAFV88_13580 [Planctomycetota bacterium]
MNQTPSQPQGEPPTRDTDPMVDVLLAEFIPSDPSRQKTPPDLTAQILARLAGEETTSSTHASVTVETAAPSRELRSGARSRFLYLILAAAASVLGLLWLSSGDKDPQQAALPNQIGSVADSNPIPDDNQVTTVPETGNLDGSDSSANRIVSNPRVITPPSPEPGTTSVPKAASGDPRVADSKADRVPLPEFVAATTQTAQTYWESLGIQPTPPAPDVQVASRLKRRLGVTLTADMIADPQRLRAALSQPVYASEVAKQFLVNGLGSNLATVDAPQNVGLVDELSRSIASGKRFDATLVSLIDGSNPHSAQWYDAVAQGGTERLASRLAGLSMNADLRCVRCHDSMVAGTATQDDYWSFVALLKERVGRENGKWSIRAETSSDVQTFYELPDGRQKLASPGVPVAFVRDESPMADFDEWTKSLGGSASLADGLVDTLWKMVHGRGLLPSPVDAFAPPSSEALTRLHRELSNDPDCRLPTQDPPETVQCRFC